MFEGRFGRMFRNLEAASFGKTDAENLANLAALGKAMSADFEKPKQAWSLAPTIEKRNSSDDKRDSVDNHCLDHEHRDVRERSFKCGTLPAVRACVPPERRRRVP